MAEKGASVIGVDISDFAIGKAKSTALKKGTGFCDMAFLIMDAENMAFKDNVFDIISCSGILHHLNIDIAFSEIRSAGPLRYSF